MPETLDELREKLKRFSSVKITCLMGEDADTISEALDIAVADCERRIAERVKELECRAEWECHWAMYSCGQAARKKHATAEKAYRAELARHKEATHA